ncbi:MAG: nucleotidyltransferase domain-containing protein [Candidatus Methanomethylicia archaeon]
MKIMTKGDEKRIIYNTKHWDLFKKLRDKAKSIMEILETNGIKCLVYGSLARGDVNEKSDIDILIPYTISSYRIETIFDDKGMKPKNRELTQATPLHVVKAHIKLEDNIVITFPMMEMRRLEREFYKFSGEVTLEEVICNKRTAGVSKKLILIEPTEDGHIELPVIGREAYVAKVVGVSIDIIKERVRVLSRRNEIGRTGIYLKYPLAPNESFEDVFKKILDRDPAIRRRSRV